MQNAAFCGNRVIEVSLGSPYPTQYAHSWRLLSHRSRPSSPNLTAPSASDFLRDVASVFNLSPQNPTFLLLAAIFVLLPLSGPVSLSLSRENSLNPILTFHSPTSRRFPASTPSLLKPLSPLPKCSPSELITIRTFMLFVE